MSATHAPIGYVPSGFAPATQVREGLARIERTSKSPSGFSPAVSYAPDPSAVPVCADTKRDGSPCKAPPLNGWDVCLAHSRGKKNDAKIG